MQFRVCQLKMLLALLLPLRQKVLQGETSNTVQLTSSSTGFDLVTLLRKINNTFTYFFG